MTFRDLVLWLLVTVLLILVLFGPGGVLAAEAPRPQATVEWRDDRVAWEFTLLIALKSVRQALRKAGCQQVVLVVLTPTLTDDRRIRVEGFCADEWD